MKKVATLGVTLGASLLVATPAVFAEGTVTVENRPTANPMSLIPTESVANPPNADGSASARVGLNHLKYLVVSIDEEGNQTLSHQPIKDYEEGSEEAAAESGEE